MIAIRRNAIAQRIELVQMRYCATMCRLRATHDKGFGRDQIWRRSDCTNMFARVCLSSNVDELGTMTTSEKDAFNNDSVGAIP